MYLFAWRQSFGAEAVKMNCDEGVLPVLIWEALLSPKSEIGDIHMVACADSWRYLREGKVLAAEP